MNKVQETIAQWVQRIVGRTDADKPVRSDRQPAELDPQSLREVSGGTGSTDSPNKGW